MHAAYHADLALESHHTAPTALSSVPQVWRASAAWLLLQVGRNVDADDREAKRACFSIGECFRHHESLAPPVIVRMITRYIADHRSIFEDNSRRAALVEILRLFSEVGWSDALKLRYELPDLLR